VLSGHASFPSISLLLLRYVHIYLCMNSIIICMSCAYCPCPVLATGRWLSDGSLTWPTVLRHFRWQVDKIALAGEQDGRHEQHPSTPPRNTASGGPLPSSVSERFLQAQNASPRQRRQDGHFGAAHWSLSAVAMKPLRCHFPERGRAVVTARVLPLSFCRGDALAFRLLQTQEMVLLPSLASCCQWLQAAVRTGR